ncbi:uncharacterized protein LOC132065973 [Lycium ferocissimum]|uniref:uncharacterized protein LOC132065973 n=1 Tax=Lycium ferocissimum TaxID=112874 RepID=UPI002815FDDA|nr:uncharacterized protein LOC132065973 [Lycium ferocissimum]
MVRTEATIARNQGPEPAAAADTRGPATARRCRRARGHGAAPANGRAHAVDRVVPVGSSSAYQYSPSEGCFVCGELGHIARRCPRSRQDYQPQRTPASSGGRRGTSQRGGTKAGRGGSHVSRGGSQVNRDGSQSSRGGSQSGHDGA